MYTCWWCCMNTIYTMMVGNGCASQLFSSKSFIFLFEMNFRLHDAHRIVVFKPLSPPTDLVVLALWPGQEKGYLWKDGWLDTYERYHFNKTNHVQDVAYICGEIKFSFRYLPSSPAEQDHQHFCFIFFILCSTVSKNSGILWLRYGC